MVFCLEHPKRDQNLKFTLLPASPHLSYGSPPPPGFAHGNFNFFTANSFYSRQFQFYSRQFQFAHGNFNLFTAISICSRRFQFSHGNFAILLRAISTFSQQRSRHFSLLSPPVSYGGRQWPRTKSQNIKSKVDIYSPSSKRKVKIANQKSIYELAELGGIYMRLGRTQTGVSSCLSSYISFHAFTELKMNSDRSDFISVADPTRVTFVPV